MGLRTTYTPEPVLGKLANKYDSDGYIADKIFKEILISTNKAKVPDWAKDSLRIPTNTIRPRGGEAHQITRGQVTFNDITTDFHALKDSIDIQDWEDYGEAGLGDSKKDSTMTLTKMLKNAHEYEVATMIQDTNNYSAGNKTTTTSGDQWSHADVDIYSQIMDAKSAVRSKVFKIPNTLILPYDAMIAALKSPKLIAKIGANRDGILYEEDFARFFGFKNVLFGAGQYVDDDGVAQDFWSDNVIIGYVPESANRQEVAPGYTFRRKNKIQVKSWQSDDQNTTWIQAEDRKKPVALQMDCMYIYNDVLA